MEPDEREAADEREALRAAAVGALDPGLGQGRGQEEGRTSFARGSHSRSGAAECAEG